MEEKKDIIYTHVCTDVETTGLSPDKDEIVEIAATEFNLDGEIGETMWTMCKPMSGHINKHASAVNNIYIEDVKDSPNYLRDGVREKFAKFFGKRILVGHNIDAFDIKFIKVKPVGTIDTLTECRKEHRGRNNLKAACKRKGLEWDDDKAHRATYDVDRTIALLLSMRSSEREKKELESQMPMFADPVPEKVEMSKKMGIIPSEEDRKLMATQTYSFSRINLYYQCAFKWYMQYIKKVPQPDQPYFKTGKICHSIAEWSGEWCYRVLFANKFTSYYKVKNLDLLNNSELVEKVKKNIKKEGDVNEFDVGLYLYDNSQEIKNYVDGIGGKASMVTDMDASIDPNSYEKPSMPDWDSYELIMQDAVNRHKCTDPSVINDARDIMKKWYNIKDFSLMPGDITITEKRLVFDSHWDALSDWYSNDAFFRGIIDVIDYFGDYVVITDYKSDRVMLNAKEIENHPQLMIYVFLVYLFLPKDSYKKIIIRLEYLRYGETREHTITDVKAWADRALKWINDGIQAIEKEMLIGDGTAFKPTRNENCHSCHIGEMSMCPLFDKSKINNIDDPFSFVVSDVEDCKTAWKRVEANKMENKRLTSLCKSFVKGRTDKITIDEEAKLDFFVTDETKYDTSKVMELLLGKGIDIRYLAKFLNMTDTSMKALCKAKGLELSPEELSSVSVKKTKTTFDAYTEKEAKKKKVRNT